MLAMGRHSSNVACRGVADSAALCAIPGISLALFQAASMRRHPAAANVTIHRYILSALAALLFAANASAGVQSLEAIQAAAEQFVRASLPEKSAKHFVTAHGSIRACAWMSARRRSRRFRKERR